MIEPFGCELATVIAADNFRRLALATRRLQDAVDVLAQLLTTEDNRDGEYVVRTEPYDGMTIVLAYAASRTAIQEPIYEMVVGELMTAGEQRPYVPTLRESNKT